MRILHVVSKLNRGGIENFLMNIYREVDIQKIQFDFLVHSPEIGEFEDEIRERGGRIFRVSPRRESFYKNKRELHQLFHNNRYQVVHQHVSSLSYIEPLKIAKKFEVPIRIVHIHSIQQSGNKIHEILHKFNKWNIKRKATNFFACSIDAAKWGIPSSIFNNKDFNIVKNAINIDDFIYDSEIRRNIRTELFIDKDTTVLGNVARFNEMKNHEFLLEIFTEYKKLNNNSKLLLIGDGDLKQKMINLTHKLDIAKDVLFIGSIDNVNEYLQAMDQFVFPSKYEGLGLSLIEAQAAGLKSYAAKNRVPEEVRITELVSFLNLDSNAFEWAENIFRNQEYVRESQIHSIEKAGYKSKDVSEWLTQFYIKNLERDYKDGK